MSKITTSAITIPASTGRIEFEIPSSSSISVYSNFCTALIIGSSTNLLTCSVTYVSSTYLISIVPFKTDLSASSGIYLVYSFRNPSNNI